MGDTLVRPQGGTGGRTYRFEAFRELVSQTFVPLLAETDDERSFDGTVGHAELGPLRLAHVTAGPHMVRRDERLIRRSDPDYYKLSLQVAGTGLLSQGGQDATLNPGDLAIYDTTRPYELRFGGPFRMLVLMFPRSLLNLPERSVRLIAGRRIPGDHRLPQLIVPFVTGLLAQAGRCAADANRHLCDAVLDMLAAALADELDVDPQPTPGPRQAALLRRIKNYIEDQLADPDLHPATIATAHHISPRYLRKLFEAEGESVARWIRSRRLEHCRRDLARMDLCDKSVSSVARRWGFTDSAHFSRLFRAAFGQTPRDYRAGALSSARDLPRTA